MLYDEDIDAIGLLCPLPVLRAKKRMKGMVAGTVVRLTTTDPAALIDVPHFCSEGGHELIEIVETDGATRFFIRKSAAAQIPDPE